jgi:hypothetical protein
MTTETTTTSADAIATVDAYLAAWNETDETTRAALAEQALGADLWYRDPLLEVDGVAAFVATIGFVQQQFPGHVMSRTSGLDAHHDVVRFNWALGVPGEAPAIAGVDVAKLDAEGRLHRIVGFTPETID